MVLEARAAKFALVAHSSMSWKAKKVNATHVKKDLETATTDLLSVVEIQSEATWSRTASIL
jgi:hypothetical protein